MTDRRDKEKAMPSSLSKDSQRRSGRKNLDLDLDRLIWDEEYRRQVMEQLSKERQKKTSP
tara:strand:- start:3469 stop:3648 length:180 start_codon:yes stop_codon:yes gene_type:complete